MSDFDSGGPKEPHIRWGPDLTKRQGNLKGEQQLIVKYRDSAISCAKLAEPIEMPFAVCNCAVAHCSRSHKHTWLLHYFSPFMTILHRLSAQIVMFPYSTICF